ncbi:MAG: heme NO-binding domain-containing protein [Granulosicoccus sp.]
MYGLVNKAVEQLVKSQFGEDKWSEIATKANVEHSFISMDTYSDQVTYDLVAAASEILEIPAVEILEAFGEHWIQYTVDEGYGQTVSMYGNSVPEFLHNLNNLHAQIRLSLPELNPPTITCETTGSGDFLVCYQSDRAGLAPMLVGLLRGLGKRFCTPVTVEYVPPIDQVQTQEYFLVSYAVQKAA